MVKTKTLKQFKLFGLKINNLTKIELLENIQNLIEIKKPSYIVTPYSEFFLISQKDQEFKNVINSADLAIPDGVSIAFSRKYLEMPGVYWPLFLCFFHLIFNKKFFKDQQITKLSGSDIIYDVSKLAAKNKYKVFFLGGFDFGNGQTGELAAKKMQDLYPGLTVVGTYSGSPKSADENQIIKIINQAKPDILYIAYGPVAQEKWIYRNHKKLVPCVSFCLGGTFDFVSGQKQRVPKWISNFGLEWFFRPLISERGNPKLIIKRINRAWFGVINYILLLVKEKKKLRFLHT